MCNFFSGIIKPNHAGVWFDPFIDSHSELMEKFNIRDNMPRASFVKFEITPIDGDVFNHTHENWKYQLDSDHAGQMGIPEWYDAEKGEKQARTALKSVLESTVLYGAKNEEIAFGRTIRFAKNCAFTTIRGTVQEVWGGTVQEVWGGTVQEVWGGTVQKVLGGGTVQKVLGGTVQKVLGGGTVQEVWGGTVQEVWGGTVQKVLGGGTVIAYSKNAKIILIKGMAIVIDRSGNHPVIRTADKGVTVEFVGDTKE